MPGNNAALETLLDSAEEVARESLAKAMARATKAGAKPITPVLACETAGGDQFAVPVEGAETTMLRRIVALNLGKMMREKGVVRFVVMSEAWVTEGRSGDIPFLRPSQAPGRIDALSLQAHDIDGDWSRRMFRINRDSPLTLQPLETGTLDSRDEDGRQQSHWDNLLTEPERVIH